MRKTRRDKENKWTLGQQCFNIKQIKKGGLMVSALDIVASGLGSSPGWGHCVVFLGKTLYSYSASLHPGV